MISNMCQFLLIFLADKETPTVAYDNSQVPNAPVHGIDQSKYGMNVSQPYYPVIFPSFYSSMLCS